MRARSTGAPSCYLRCQGRNASSRRHHRPEVPVAGQAGACRVSVKIVRDFLPGKTQHVAAALNHGAILTNTQGCQGWLTSPMTIQGNSAEDPADPMPHLRAGADPGQHLHLFCELRIRDVSVVAPSRPQQNFPRRDRPRLFGLGERNRGPNRGPGWGVGLLRAG